MGATCFYIFTVFIGFFVLSLFLWLLFRVFVVYVACSLAMATARLPTRECLVSVFHKRLTY